MDLPEIVSMATNAAQNAPMPASVTFDRSAGGFMQVLQMAVRSLALGRASLSEAAPSDGVAGNGLFSEGVRIIAPGEEGGSSAQVNLSDELMARLAQLDAVAGLYLVAGLARHAMGQSEGDVSQPTASGAPEMMLPVRLPPPVARVLSQLECSGVELPEVLRLLTELTGSISDIEPVAEIAAGEPDDLGFAPISEGQPSTVQRMVEGGAEERSAPWFAAPNLAVLDRAVMALLSGIHEDAGEELPSDAPMSERLRFGLSFGRVVAELEKAFGGQPELLEALQACCGKLRGQYLQAQARTTALPSSLLGVTEWGLETTLPISDWQLSIENRRSKIGDRKSQGEPDVAFDSLEGQRELREESPDDILRDPTGVSQWVPTDMLGNGEQARAGGASELMARLPAVPSADWGQSNADGRLARTLMAGVLRDGVGQQSSSVPRLLPITFGVGAEARHAIPPVIQVGSAQLITGMGTGGTSAASPVPSVFPDPDTPANQVARVARLLCGGRASSPTVAKTGAPQSEVAVGPTVAAFESGAPGPLLRSPPGAQNEAARRGAGESADLVRATAVSGVFTGEAVLKKQPGDPNLDAVPDGIDRASILEQFSEGVRQLHVGRERSEIVIRLRPEHLGDLRVAVSVADGVVRVSIITHSHGVRAALESEIGALRESLTDAGLSVDSLQVSVASDGGTQYAPHRGREFCSEVYRSFEAAGEAAKAGGAVGPGLFTLGPGHLGSTLSLLA